MNYAEKRDSRGDLEKYRGLIENGSSESQEQSFESERKERDQMASNKGKRGLVLYSEANTRKM